MLKKLFDFKGSTLKKIYRAIMLLAIVAAIVIAAFGIKEILDVKHMKTLMGVTRLVAGDVMMYVLKKYLVWSIAVLAAGTVCFYILRAKDRKAQAAA
ncbi:MAG: hypothetical protein IJD99_08980 [Clostridia bacterium]|nr:hypothetical protein [Clostridia bacterium]